MNWKRIKREYLCMTIFIEYKYTLFRLSFCIYLKLYGSMTSQTVTIATKPNKDNHQLSDCHSANLFIFITIYEQTLHYKHSLIASALKNSFY